MTIVTHSKRVGRVALMAALALGTPSLVRGHAGDPDPGKIHACVHKKNGKVRFVDAGAECKRNENPLHLAIQGAPGPVGQTGAPGREGRSALTPLAPGETVSGVWGASVTASAGGQVYRAFASFPIPLEVDIPEGNQIYVAGESAPNCPGQGQAAPGFLCVYQGFTQNAETPVDFNIFDPSAEFGPAGSSRYGFGIYLQSDVAGLSAVSGTFAVTAP
jgi:hypothetical protein